MEAAAEWGLSPSQWRQQSLDDRARMVAHRIIRSIRQAYETPDMPKEGKQGGKGVGGGAPDHPMLRSMKMRAGIQ